MAATLLIGHGADLDLLDNVGDSALDRAERLVEADNSEEEEDEDEMRQDEAAGEVGDENERSRRAWRAMCRARRAELRKKHRNVLATLRIHASA